MSNAQRAARLELRAAAISRTWKAVLVQRNEIYRGVRTGDDSEYSAV